MPANVNFRVEFVGAAAVTLPVDIVGGPGPFAIESTVVHVLFKVTNTLNRAVTFPSISVTKEGAAKDKVTVSLLQTGVSIAAGATLENKLIVEPNEPLVEGDSFSCTVSAVEG
jgi:hypothetical protein